MIQSIRMGLVVCLLGFATTAARADLVVNGGFETGDFTGWTTVAAQTTFGGFGVTPQNPHSGNYDAYFNQFFGLNSIRQNLTTVSGSSYNLDFWLQIGGDRDAEINALVGGLTVLSITNTPSTTTYSEYTFTFLATASITSLEFQVNNGVGFAFNEVAWLDDVSVTQLRSVPEPASLTMLALGGLGLISYTLRRRKQRLA